MNLSPTELVHALDVIILAIQQNTFPDELTRLWDPNNKSISKLRGLNPFINEGEILQVGGKLVHMEIPYEQKHSKLLSRSHRFTDQLIEDFY